METMLTWLAVVFASLTVIGSMYWWWMRRERLRSDALGLVAQGLGLAFHAGETEARSWLDAHFGGAGWFVRGDGGRIENLLHGSLAGREVIVFESCFFSGSGRSRNDYEQTVVALELPGLGAGGSEAWFALHPREWRVGIARTLYLRAGTELEGAGDPRLAGVYRVYGSDHADLRARVCVPLAAYLLDHPGWWIEAWGGRVFVCRLGFRSEPEQLRGHLDQAHELLDQLVDALR